MNVQAKRIGAYQGKETWKGEYQLQPGGTFFIARSGYGAILYASEAAALAGARVCQEAELRARMIRQAGLEAVAKALSAASPCERT